MGRGSSFIMMLKELGFYIYKNESNSKWTKRPKLSYNTLKLHTEDLLDISLGIGFLAISQKSKATDAEINKCHCIKQQIIQRQLVSHLFQKGLTSHTCRESTQLNSKKT